ncbi:MAG TPA: class I poly(R)-hydroxyalkanoic acid synthase [Rhodocyclaceae bacterium]|nr:class I poly(R)-hydroxyalkanoic acid synthase [Rhodocyclaceae bacterium]
MSQQENKPQLPDPAQIANTYAEVAQRAAKLFTDHLQRQMKNGISTPTDEMGVAQAFTDMMSKMIANPYKMAQTQMNLVWDYMSLWQTSMLRFAGVQMQPVAQPAKGDNRFKDETWEEHFLFDFIKQSYLIASRHIHESVSGVEGLDDNARKKVNFFTRQFVDALSPSNFAVTNPLVLKETVQSHGQNLLKGFNNLLRDIEKGDGQLKVTMTDLNAFEMGKNVATTPGKVVFQNDLIQLMQFDPTTKEQYKKPLLIVPPWINKYYILDLREKNSYIKWATDQGHTVFCISWVNPDAHLARKSFEDYMLEGPLAALDAIEKQTGEKQVNAAGYCLGGTLLATTLAYLAAKKQADRIVSATFFTTMLDFSSPGELGVFIDEETVAGLEKKMEERGFLEGTEMAGTFNAMRANDLIWSFVVNNYLMGKEPFPFDLLFWNSDSTRMPYAMHSFYLRNMYLYNRLREKGGITIAGVPIDLSLVKTPVYFISAIEDHIAPWKSTYAGTQLFSGPIRFVLGGSGHIAGIVNPPSANKYGFWTNQQKAYPESPDTWLADAKQNEGSWWVDWQAWVDKLNGGEKIPARDPAKGKLKVLEDAPGSFAKFRLDAPKAEA